MNTANLRRLLDEATPRPWDGRHIFDGENVIQHGHDVFRCHVAITQTEVDMDLIVELVNNADELLAESERLRAAKCLTWSFIRTLLEQGAAIRQDYDAGKFGDSYEAYSARIDEAAREREDTLTALEKKP